MAQEESGFEQLTWEHLTSWAGTKILTRGKSYKQQVSDLRRIHDGGILAWVQGTKRYATLVKRESSGTLSAMCSCPYGWSPCKHSVAVVLAYLDSMKKNQDVPDASKNDRRLKLVSDISSQAGAGVVGEDEDDDDGETGTQITECMEVVLQAVPGSSLSLWDQILWIVDTQLLDEYGLLDGSEKCLARFKDRKAWSLVADTLLQRLENMPGERKKNDFPIGYRREKIMYWAIDENDNDSVIRRYDLAKQARYFDISIRNEVADAVKDSHPDVSLEIWKNMAEEQIRLVKPAAYEVAATYLRKMRDMYKKTHRMAEWTALINGIRAAHKPKRSLMQILDTLEAKRILDT